MSKPPKRILATTIHAGAGLPKSYAVPYFKKMVDKCMPNVDFLVAVPFKGAFGESFQFEELVIEDPAMESGWATEIVHCAKGKLVAEAYERGYDAILWQGIDCFYDSREDWEKLMSLAQDHDFVGAVVAGRNRPDYPVCREFKHTEYNKFSTEQVEVDEAAAHFYVMEGIARRTHGYIGSDATIISREAFSQISMDGYQHWHLFKDMIPHCIGPEEFYTYEALSKGIIPIAHYGVRPWHMHEDRFASRYPGERVHGDELPFMR